MHVCCNGIVNIHADVTRGHHSLTQSSFSSFISFEFMCCTRYFCYESVGDCSR